MDKYKEYAMQVVNGDIPTCIYVKQACQRYLDFFEKYDFRTDKVDGIINFISKIKHFKGEFAGKTFELLPYQKWMIYAIFGFYHKGTENRVTNQVYIELARKNGKTALIAAICLYMMIADGENGAEVELVANSAKQAGICFEMCDKFANSLDPKHKFLKKYRDKIKFDATSSKLQVLSSDSKGNDGYNSSCFVLDEAHEQKDSKLWDVMTSSQSNRKNSLAIIITTAGFNKFGFCYPQRQSYIKILDKHIENDSQFAAIYTLDEEDDWKDEKNWIKSNPSYGVTVFPDRLRQQIREADINPYLTTGILTKHFNRWVDSVDIWIASDILLNATQRFNLEEVINEDTRCYVGVDLASVSDLTAVAYLIPKLKYDENGYTQIDKIYIKTDYYLPSSCLENNVNSYLYKTWTNKGYLKITPGNVTDYDYVVQDLDKINQMGLLEKVSYDQYNATQWAIDCTNRGMNLVPFAQGLWNFNKPTKEFERLLGQGKIVLDDNPINRWCFQNVQMKVDYNENVKPDKATKQNKIDGVIAMVEGLGGFLEDNNYFDTSL